MNTKQLRQYVQLHTMEKLGKFSPSFFDCNCFAVYLQLANSNTELSAPAKEILAGYEWDDCPEPRCPECTDKLYRSIQNWMQPIITGELKTQETAAHE